MTINSYFVSVAVPSDCIHVVFHIRLQTLCLYASYGPVISGVGTGSHNLFISQGFRCLMRPKTNSSLLFGAKAYYDICPGTLSVPRSQQFFDWERSSRETVSFGEQIMSKDKYSSLLSRQMEAFVFIILQIFFVKRAALKIGECHSDILQF